MAHEHMVSSLLHDIVAERMRAFGKREGAPLLIVATLTGERHAIGAVLVGAAAAVEGWNVLHLGADLPATAIVEAARSADARVVAVSIVYVENREALLEELRTLRAALPAPSRSSPAAAERPPSPASWRRSVCASRRA